MAFTAQQVISNLSPAELEVWNGLTADQKQTILAEGNYPNVASIKGFLDSKMAKNVVSQNSQPAKTKPSPSKRAPNSDDQIQSSLPTNEPVPFAPIPNVLRDYASFITNISWQVTNNTNFNELINTQQYHPEKWDTICKTGGIGPTKATGTFGSTANTTNVSKYFARDLYIDDVVVNTICGMSQENRGTNATDIEFTVVEPFGMDLIEQLYDYCHIALKEENYCQLPYLLKIEFIGYKDDGTRETVPFATKFIPIALGNMDIKVNNMGAEYKITAFAYNELGNSEQYGRVPCQIQVGNLASIDATDAFIISSNGFICDIATGNDL